MSDREPTLRDILLPGAGELPDHVWSQLEAARPVKELKDRILSWTPGFDWAAEADRIAGMVFDLLDVGIIRGVLAKVWNERGVFRKYLDPERYPPDETVEVVLEDHTVTSKHQPRIEPRVNGDPASPIVLDVNVIVTVQGAVIEVRGGKIKRIRTGEIRGGGDLKWEGFLLASEKLKPIQRAAGGFGDGGIPVVG
jgi:hypothetical protein